MGRVGAYGVIPIASCINALIQRDKERERGTAVQTLDKPVDDQHDEHAIDQLIPRPPSRPKRFAMGVALVAGCVAFGWAWGTGDVDQSQRRGLISTSALNAADESVEIESLRDTMCGFAGASS